MALHGTVFKQTVLVCLVAFLTNGCGGGGSESGDSSSGGGNGSSGTTISGVILASGSTAQNPIPLSGGEVSFSLGANTYKTPVDSNGRFSLAFGSSLQNAPAWVAGTYHKEGYLTQTINLRVNSGTTSTVPIQVNGTPLSDADIPVTSTYGQPYDLSHLGDDNFQGSVNSQLQISSRGLSWFGVVAGVTQAQLYKYPAGACVTLDIRGVDAGNGDKIIFQGEEKELFPSPADGSFGRQTHCFTAKPATHVSGSTLRVESRHKSGDSDYDDFEFINVKVHFSEALPSLPITISGGGSYTWLAGNSVAFSLTNVWMSNIAKVIWQFGDGSSEQVVENSLEVAHAYATAGNKSVTAVFKDSAGNTLGQALLDISIAVLPTPSNASVMRLPSGAVQVNGISDAIGTNIRVTWPDNSICEFKNVSPPDYWACTSSNTAFPRFQTIKIQSFLGSAVSGTLNRSTP